MSFRLLAAALLAAVFGLAEGPAGRWDGTIFFDRTPIPFTIHFEGSAQELRGSFVNGDARVSSTSGRFEAGTLQLIFEPHGSRMDATLADDVLTGTYRDPRNRILRFTASKYCTCSVEGEAGPAIVGTWEVFDTRWRLLIRRIGEDTFVTVSRPGDTLGPLAGRFNGAYFDLKYFDGDRAALLEIEPRKDNTLDLAWKIPGEDFTKYKAVRTASGK